jgi:hypothetical protein
VTCLKIAGRKNALETDLHKEEDRTAEIFWVFRDDVWKRSRTEILVRYPSDTYNLALAQKVFAEGRERGLIDMHAIAITQNKVAATVWFPKYPDEEVQGWNRGMKLSISQPLLRAKTFGPLCWLVFRFLPRFRHYQKAELVICTKAWAAP